MTDPVFEEWMQKVFAPHTAGLRAQNKTPYLFLDNFGSHVTPAVLRSAADNGIEIFGLPAHSSHVTQPLDVSVNGPLKQYYTEHLAFFRAANDFERPGRNISPRDALRVLALPQKPGLPAAIDRAMCPANLRSGFAKTGIYPLDEAKALAGLLAGPAAAAAPACAPAPASSPAGPSSANPLAVLADAVNIAMVRDMLGVTVDPAPVAKPRSRKRKATGPRLLTAAGYLERLEAEQAAKAREEAEKQAKREQRETKRLAVAAVAEKEAAEKATEARGRKFLKAAERDPQLVEQSVRAVIKRILCPAQRSPLAELTRKQALARWKAKRARRRACAGKENRNPP